MSLRRAPLRAAGCERTGLHLQRDREGSFPNFDSALGSRHWRARSLGAADAARTRRRGDRITAINPLGMSLPGTFQTCRLIPRMSANRGRPEVIRPRAKPALMTLNGPIRASQIRT